MTKKQRAQVVELLRCAADLVDRSLLPVRYACEYLNRPWRHMDIALLARQSLGEMTPATEGYRRDLLEAALRVEQGEWP